MKQYADDQFIAGAVALVLRDGRVVYERSVGWSDKEAGRPMTPDAIFRIASQTKAITRMGVLSALRMGRVGRGITTGGRPAVFRAARVWCPPQETTPVFSR